MSRSLLKFNRKRIIALLLLTMPALRTIYLENLGGSPIYWFDYVIYPCGGILVLVWISLFLVLAAFSLGYLLMVALGFID